MLDIRDLMNLKEAYNAVYAPQELTEEQVWEEVENWVNSLVEEGYDLSDYTWEEMYESYIKEASDLEMGLGRKVLRNRANSPTASAKTTPTPARTLSAADRSRSRRDARPSSSSRSPIPGGSEANPPSAAAAKKDEADPRRNSATAGSPPLRPPAAGSPPSRPAAASGPVLSKKDGVEGTGVGANFKAKAFTDAEKSRYSSVATQNAARSSAPTAPKPTPAATAAPKPTPAATAAPKPATGMLGKTSFERRTPTSVELKAAQAARAGGEKDPEKVLQAAKASSAPAAGNTLSQTTAAASKPAAFSPTPAATSTPAGNTLSQTTAAASKPAAFSPTPAAKSTLKKPIVSSFDMFDVVKGYLIGEGYADTEEAALAIMINMSEEWKQSIIKSI